MTNWPSCPLVLEINTWAWLAGLRRAAGVPLSLADVPQAELERLARLGYDGLWLMGVWQRSPTARRVAQEHPGLRKEYLQALPDLTLEDVVGSPYAILDYQVDPHLGGDEALAALRKRLAALGLRLILDFVPNHVARDHRWTIEHPEWLVQGGSDSLARASENYFALEADGQWRVFAHGRDPNFAGWTDTVQIDYRVPQARQAMVATLLQVSERCDGVRCDMAMLVTREVFRRTWGGEMDLEGEEFWVEAIAAVTARHPGFLMLAEAYWDMEWQLQQQGFAYVYDKRLYDRLLGGDAMAVRMHVEGDLAFQRRLVRFIENHDERRAIEAFGPARSRAAAVACLTLPGLRLLHEGQAQGWRRKLPVQLGRRQPETAEPGFEAFYERLLAAVRAPVAREGEWRPLKPLPEWQGNPSHRNAVACQWSLGSIHHIVAVNLSPEPAQFFLPIEISDLSGSDWVLVDLLHDRVYERAGSELASRGLYIGLPGFGYHLFQLSSASTP